MITDDQIHEMLASTSEGQQSVTKRALRNDCLGALEGSVVCRARCARVVANQQTFILKRKA